MPIFVFHFERQGAPPERVEVELPSHDAAYSQAVQALGELLRDAKGGLWDAPAVGLRVMDEAGGWVCELHLQGRRATG